MANYVYECDQCNRVFEVMKPMSELIYPEKCAKCGNMQTKRVYTAPFIKIK